MHTSFMTSFLYNSAVHTDLCNDLYIGSVENVRKVCLGNFPQWKVSTVQFFTAAYNKNWLVAPHNHSTYINKNTAT